MHVTVSKCRRWLPQGVFFGGLEGLAYLALAAAAATEAFKLVRGVTGESG